MLPKIQTVNLLVTEGPGRGLPTMLLKILNPSSKRARSSLSMLPQTSEDEARFVMKTSQICE
jgi:hypothetical protein